MLVYLLKFSTCLAIFMVFYKLFLERESMHHIKRYYLLAALILSLSIPFITFIQYVEPTITESFVQPIDNITAYTAIENVPASTNYTPLILWTIYGFGFLIFGLKFSLNLFQIFKKIKRNPKFKKQRFVNVLLIDLITPHTFFSYIFLNKHKYEAHEIPKEVFIHEQAHAEQKHSIDVLFIELLQVVFWFNPLLYLIKRDIKLNHEFLADHAVLKNGILPSAYQNLLLAFSSDAQHVELANAINYSSIKKRFTVMKTHTSKQKIWLRSLLLLPLVALTLYGFSEKKEVLKQGLSTAQDNIPKLESYPTLEISFNPNVFRLNGKETSLSKLKEDFAQVTNNEQSDLRIKTVGGINMSFINQIMDELKGNLLKIRLDEAAYIIGDTTQQKATLEEVAEYNKLAKHYNTQSEDHQILKLKDLKRLKELYDKMSKDQKANAQPLPNFPPPPPPPSKDAPQVVQMQDLPPPPPIPTDATPEQRKKHQSAIDNYNSQKEGYIYKHTTKDGKLVDVVVIPDSDKIAPPPPPLPAPKSPLDHVIEIAKKGATFYYDSKMISSDEAIKLLKKNKELNISTKQVDSKEPKVYISKEPIVIKD